MRRRHKAPVRESGLLWDRPQLLNLLADGLLVLGSAGLAYAVALVVMRLPVFPLREVVLTTPLGQVTSAQIEYAARSSLAGNFFTVNLDRVQAAFEKLPWVRHAEVRRRWPNALELAIEEHRPAAYWKTGDETRLVNEQGEVFAAASEAALPVLSGPEGLSPLMLERLRDFGRLVAPLGRTVAGLALSARQAWQLKLDDGLTIELGRDQPKSPVAERLARFVAVQREARERLGREIVVADLRYPNGFALRGGRATNIENKGRKS